MGQFWNKPKPNTMNAINNDNPFVIKPHLLNKEISFKVERPKNDAFAVFPKEILLYILQKMDSDPESVYAFRVVAKWYFQTITDSEVYKVIYYTFFF
jgi:hypothetical protein